MVLVGAARPGKKGNHPLRMPWVYRKPIAFQGKVWGHPQKDTQFKPPGFRAGGLERHRGPPLVQNQPASHKHACTGCLSFFSFPFGAVKPPNHPFQQVRTLKNHDFLVLGSGAVLRVFGGATHFCSFRPPWTRVLQPLTSPLAQRSWFLILGCFDASQRNCFWEATSP